MAYTDQKEDQEEPNKVDDEEEEKKSSGGLGYLTSAFSRIGLSSLTSSSTPEDRPEEEGTEKGEQAEAGDFFTSAINKVAGALFYSLATIKKVLKR